MEKNNYDGTPHISVKKGEFPKTVLFPGDPLRAKWIAETFLKNAKKINKIRNMFAYVGEYKGHKIGVMGSGMGIPSAGIYSHELFDFYDVDNIIRIGTAGGYNKDIPVGTIVMATETYSESTYAQMMNVECDGENILKANPTLVELAKKSAQESNINFIEGLMHSADAFYNAQDINKYIDMGIDAVEMEAFAIYTNAKKLNKNGLAIATISDNIVTRDNMPPVDRQTKLVDMVKIALETAVKYEELANGSK